MIDHANQLQAFRNGNEVMLPNLVTAAKTTGTTYTIELSIAASSLSLFAFGSTLGFDIGFEGGDAAMM